MWTYKRRTFHQHYLIQQGHWHSLHHAMLEWSRDLVSNYFLGFSHNFNRYWHCQSYWHSLLSEHVTWATALIRFNVFTNFVCCGLTNRQEIDKMISILIKLWFFAQSQSESCIIWSFHSIAELEFFPEQASRVVCKFFLSLEEAGMMHAPQCDDTLSTHVSQLPSPTLKLIKISTHWLPPSLILLCKHHIIFVDELV